MASMHLEVRGRVQGVGFRWYVLELARKLGLAGWVKNRADGVLEIAAAGEPEALAKLEAALTAGPPGAKVEEVRKLNPVAGEKLQIPFGIVR